MNYSEGEKLFGLPPGYTDHWSRVVLAKERIEFLQPPSEIKSPSWEEIIELLDSQPLVVIPDVAPLVNKIKRLRWIVAK